MINRALALAAVLVAASSAASASVSANYSDLDLSTAKGQAELDKRIDRAAREVCTSHQVMTGTIKTSALDQACYRDALAKLKDQLAAVAGHNRQG